MYALLIGINEYASSTVNNLGGCTNDVDAMSQLLQERFQVPADNIRTLKNSEATAANIEAAFRSHLIERARELASTSSELPPFLFHYSGHGSQAPDPTGTEPDGMDETVVPHDSRSGDRKSVV